jgi:hypothetical protein
MKVQKCWIVRTQGVDAPLTTHTSVVETPSAREAVLIIRHALFDYDTDGSCWWDRTETDKCVLATNKWRYWVRGLPLVPEGRIIKTTIPLEAE